MRVNGKQPHERSTDTISGVIHSSLGVPRDKIGKCDLCRWSMAGHDAEEGGLVLVHGGGANLRIRSI